MALRDILTRFRFSVESGKLRRVTAATRAAEARMRSATRQARELSRSVSGIGARVGGALGIGAIGVAFAGVGRGVLDANVEFQNLNATMLTVMGTAEAAKGAMDFAADFAAKTPFQIGEVTQAFIALKRRGIEPTEEVLTALGDVAAANGRSMQDVVDGITSLASAGTTRMLEGATGMDWANRQGNVVVTLWDGTKKTIKKDVKEIARTVVELGQMQGVAGGMERRSATLGGAISNLKDKVWQFFVALGESGLSDVLHSATKGLERITGALKRWASDTERTRRILDVLVRVVKGLAVALLWMASGKIIAGLVKLTQTMRMFGNAGAIAAAKFLIIPAIIAAVALAIEDLIGFTQGKDSLFGRLLDSAGIDPEPIREAFKKIGAALEKLGAAFARVGNRIAAAFGFDSVVDAGVSLLEAMVEWTITFADTVAEWITIFAGFVDWIADHWPEITTAFQEVYNNAVQITANAMKAVVDSHQWAVNSIAQGLTDITTAYNDESSLWGAAMRGVVAAAIWMYRPIYDAMVGFYQDMLNAILSPWQTAQDWIIDWFGGKLLRTIVDLWSGAFELIGVNLKAEILGALADLLNELPDFALSALPSGIQEFVEQNRSGGGGGFAGIESATEKAARQERDRRSQERAPAFRAAARQMLVEIGAVPTVPGTRSTIPPVDRVPPGLPAPATPTVIQRTVRMGDVTVPITGTADMSAPEVVERIREGAKAVFDKLIEAAFLDTEEAA